MKHFPKSQAVQLKDGSFQADSLSTRSHQIPWSPTISIEQQHPNGKIKGGVFNSYPPEFSNISMLSSVQNQLLDNWLNMIGKSMNLGQRIWAWIQSLPLSKCGWSFNFSRATLDKLRLIAWKIVVRIISKYKKHLEACLYGIIITFVLIILNRTLSIQ